MAEGKEAWVIKVADEPAELEQVHRLNYRTFVEEIPQHEANSEGRLVDALLAGSTCYVCRAGDRVLGMVAISDRRPFSLDRKLPDLDGHLPPGSVPCEVRLLAVEPERRGGVIFTALIRQLLRHSRQRGFTVAVISAARSQERLYRHLGFVPFGPPLGTAEAPFQGMYLTWDLLRAGAPRLADEVTADGERGPVLLKGAG